MLKMRNVEYVWIKKDARKLSFPDHILLRRLSKITELEALHPCVGLSQESQASGFYHLLGSFAKVDGFKFIAQPGL